MRRGAVVPYLLFGLAVVGGLLAIFAGLKITEAETTPVEGETNVEVESATVEPPGSLDQPDVLPVGTETVTSGTDPERDWIEVEPLPSVAPKETPVGRVVAQSTSEIGSAVSGSPDRAIDTMTKPTEESSEPDESVALEDLRDSVATVEGIAMELNAESYAPVPLIQGQTLSQAAEREAAAGNRDDAIYLYGRAEAYLGQAAFNAAIAGLQEEVEATGIPPEVVAANPAWGDVLELIENARTNLASGAVEDAVAIVAVARRQIDDVRIQILDTKRSEARAAVSRGQTAVAMELYRQLVAWAPGDPEAERFLARNRFLPGERYQTGIGMELVFVPPGRFFQGSPEDEPGRDRDEWQHEVVIGSGFFIGIGEVTQAQWEAVMGDLPDGVVSGPSAMRGPDLPVHSVSWDAATAFCARLSEQTGSAFRLPTEAEWEYAARAGSETPFVNGRTRLEPGAAVAFDGRGGRLRLLGSARDSGEANALGLVHVHGNLWEWTAESYAEYPGGGSIDEMLAGMKVVRGGSLIDPPIVARLANRWAQPPETTNPYIGFRVVMEIPEGSGPTG